MQPDAIAVRARLTRKMHEMLKEYQSTGAYTDADGKKWDTSGGIVNVWREIGALERAGTSKIESAFRGEREW